MTEFDRMRERAHKGRQHVFGRRTFLKGLTIGGVAGSIAANIAAEGGGLVAERTVLADNTIDPMSTPAPDMVLDRMPENPIRHAQEIFAETGGLNAMWWEKARKAGVLDYATRVRRRDDGRLVITHHGPGLVLWGDDAPSRMVGVALDEQPDRKFGRFADRCMWEVLHRRDPALHARRAETFRKGFDDPRLIEYYAWAASDGEDAVSVALTMEQVAQTRSAGKSRRDSEEEDRPLQSHDTTTPAHPAHPA